MTASRTALITLGRLPVALEIARGLDAAGWRVVVAEPFRLHLCRFSKRVAASHRTRSPVEDEAGYLDDLERVIRAEAVTLVVPVSEETPFVAGLHARDLAGVRVSCPRRATLLALHDKLRFAEWAASADLAVPETARADTEEALRLAATHAHVLKPRLSSSGVGVALRERGAPLTERSPTRLVQRRLGPASLCTFTVARDGRALASVAYRGLLESGSVSVRFESIELPPGCARTIDAVLGAWRPTGFIAFDFLADEAGEWHVIECNPRATSGIHLLGEAALADALAALAATEDDGGPAACADDRARNRDRVAAIGADIGVSTEAGIARQESWTSLTELQSRLLRGRFDVADWRALFRTRDVTWRRDDPWPFLGMTLASLPLLARAIRRRRPITEVTTDDIGWYVDPEVIGEGDRGVPESSGPGSSGSPDSPGGRR